jgi:hypothetical protein
MTLPQRVQYGRKTHFSHLPKSSPFGYRCYPPLDHLRLFSCTWLDQPVDKRSYSLGALVVSQCIRGRVYVCTCTSRTTTFEHVNTWCTRCFTRCERGLCSGRDTREMAFTCLRASVTPACSACSVETKHAHYFGVP